MPLEWVERAKIFAEIWPNITNTKAALPDEKYQHEHNKLKKYIQLFIIINFQRNLVASLSLLPFINFSKQSIFSVDTIII